MVSEFSGTVFDIFKSFPCHVIFIVCKVASPDFIYTHTNDAGSRFLHVTGDFFICNL